MDIRSSYGHRSSLYAAGCTWNSPIFSRAIAAASLGDSVRGGGPKRVKQQVKAPHPALSGILVQKNGVLSPLHACRQKNNNDLICWRDPKLTRLKQQRGCQASCHPLAVATLGAAADGSALANPATGGIAAAEGGPLWDTCHHPRAGCAA